MPPRIVAPNRNGAAAFLVRLFTLTEQQLIAEITRKREQGYVDYAELAALERVRKTLLGMTKKSAEYVPLAIEREFYKGEAARAGYANARAVASPTRLKVIEQLTDNLLGEIEEMAETAYQSTASKLLLIGRTSPDVFRAPVLTAAVEAQAAGRGSMTTVSEIVKSIENTGITAFVDKAGREWSLKDYGTMAVRTTVRQAQVSAVLTEDEHDLYKILAIGSTCPICSAYEGRVYSKSGTDPNYPPLAAAFGKIDPAGPDDLSNTFLNIHPSCQHSLVKWTEKGKTEKQIQKERDFSSPEKRPFDVDYRSKKQREAYQEKERTRAKYRSDLHQWERYREALGDKVPKTLDTFLKHKAAGDEKYKEWERLYRAARRQT